ncbi:uncharacterized protein LOC123536826 [Mercenaria mercenaria]|uniref:uncharacterized protein LOC123536826 n=1 Tax=Mercenaria mercenaria TaxID=6596 RepID=UPI00234EBFD2|nr:uncharacterized protein LOC123536826 [Mercenaria mercenaria]
MAAGSNDFPHNNAKILYKYTPHDFGPLNVIQGDHYQNFIGGIYYVTTPREKMVLHRLHGGKAGEYGQYWTHEPRKGNEGYRWDAAVLQQWNSLDKAATLIVPEGVNMYEGKVSKQAHYLGGGWQIFIPREIVNLLAEIQPHKMAERGYNETFIKQKIHEINTAQQKIMQEYNDKLTKRIEQRALQHGSELWNLPPEIRKVVQGDGSNKSDGKVKTGSYVVHRDSIPVPGGGRKNISVSVKIEFVRSDTRTYQSGKTIITETTNYYNRITEIRET